MKKLIEQASDLSYLAGGQTSYFQTMERRLVLSAQAIVDVLAELTPSTPPIESHVQEVPIVSTDEPTLDLHLREAHQATGWNNVQNKFGLTGSGQTVAVIDTGIAWDHQALGAGFGEGYRVVGGWDFTEENDANPYDDGPAGFHGTHVAGIIGSSNSLHQGVARDVDLVALRVFNDAGQGQLAWVEKALQWVHANRNSFENPITTVNLSLGTTWNANTIPSWAMLEDEFQQLKAAGIVVVASAGNSFQSYNVAGVSYPAASPNVLPVASVNDSGTLSDFSQRNDRVLAAPGERIVSTVPDYVFGRDGIVNDFGSASGTSMAAPYVAGASVLVRQAMEMVDYGNISLDTIAAHFHNTSDPVYDPITGATYNRLNLDRAIDSLIPDDVVGNSYALSQQVDLTTGRIDGWINQLNDVDVYRFTPNQSGTLSLAANSEWATSLSWSLRVGGTQIESGALGSSSFSLVSGTTYELIVSSPGAIGGFSFDLDFAPQSSGSGGEGSPGNGAVNTIGEVGYYSDQVAGGQTYRFQAVRDGLFTSVWTNDTAHSGSMLVQVEGAGGSSQSDSAWEGNQLRTDVSVRRGDWVQVLVPGSGQYGELTVLGLVSVQGTSAAIYGTTDTDQFEVQLGSSSNVSINGVSYAFGVSQVTSISIQDAGSSDSIAISGAGQGERVELRPGDLTLSNSTVQLRVTGIEDVVFTGGGGPDRVYLYDSDGDDRLTAYPGQATLEGVGYRYQVFDIDRMFMHATGAGQDFAYLYDSTGNDTLSVRPQFTSMAGDGYFNYVRGFERVYAYANAGGIDTADLYDSNGNDRFTTNGAAASIVGQGFSSYTRFFENVNAHSTSGGFDTAAMYGSNSQTTWNQGANFLRFQEQPWVREARSFESLEAYVAGSPMNIAALVAQSNSAMAMSSDLSVTSIAAENFNVSIGPSLTLDPTHGNTVDLAHYAAPLSTISSPASRLPEFGATIGSEQPLCDLSYEFVSQSADFPFASGDQYHADWGSTVPANVEDWVVDSASEPEDIPLKDLMEECALLDEIYRSEQLWN